MKYMCYRDGHRYVYNLNTYVNVNINLLKLT